MRRRRGARNGLPRAADDRHANDIIGGNSGSPVIDKDLQVVGLIFDGFDASANRAVAVDARAILESLDKVYGAKVLAEELRGKRLVAAN